MTSVTGNLSTDYSTLQQMVAGQGTDGGDLQAFAEAVAKEASSAGNSTESTAASNIANSLSDGTYNQQGSSVALANAAIGEGTDSIATNLSAIQSELQNGDTSDAINNLQALSKESYNAGDTDGGVKYAGLASSLQNGTISSSDALSELQDTSDTTASTASGSADTTTDTASTDGTDSTDTADTDSSTDTSSTTSPELTGDLSSDYSTLQQLVAAQGTDGDTLKAYAAGVAQEASAAGNSTEATAASNIANSLDDGTYNQQGSSVALANAAIGEGTDSIATNLSAIQSELQNGDTSDAINNLQALSKESYNAGDTDGGVKYAGLASSLQNGTISSSDALGELQDTSTTTASTATDTTDTADSTTDSTTDTSSIAETLSSLQAAVNSLSQQLGLQTA